jgi:L-ascorbate metabolism protein UlaG (beta-lactamase superfamily)
MTAPDPCTLQFIGNATVLLRLGPFTVLTDPNFLHRGQLAYLGHGLASRRLLDPALRIDQLPPLDAIVLSHMHGDHWDRVARRGLPRDVAIVTTPKAARALTRQRFTAAEGLRTWQSSTLRKDGAALTVTSMPGRHGVGIAAALLPPVMGSVLDYERDGARLLRLYVTGDTLFVDDLRPVPQRFPDIDGAVVHLGGTTLPGGLVVTMDGRQGADLLELVRPRYAVPVHYDDYGVFKSPVQDFLDETAARGHATEVRIVARGGATELITPARPG